MFLNLSLSQRVCKFIKWEYRQLQCVILPRPSQGFWEQGHLFQDNKGTKVLKREEQGNMGNFGGTGNIKIKILILGNLGTKQFI